jgi:hypothetical protein
MAEFFHHMLDSVIGGSESRYQEIRREETRLPEKGERWGCEGVEAGKDPEL